MIWWRRGTLTRLWRSTVNVSPLSLKNVPSTQTGIKWTRLICIKWELPLNNPELKDSLISWLHGPSEPFACWNWVDLKRPNRTVTPLCSWSRVTKKPSTDEPWLIKVYRSASQTNTPCINYDDKSAHYYLLISPLVCLYPRTTCLPAATSRKSSIWTPTSGRLSRSSRWWRVCWDRAWWTMLHTREGCGTNTHAMKTPFSSLPFYCWLDAGCYFIHLTHNLINRRGYICLIFPRFDGSGQRQRSETHWNT